MEKIWVLAEQSDGVPAGIVLELLTAARGFAKVVEAVTWGPGSAGVAAAVGPYGAAKLYDLGDIGESLPGPKLAAAIAAQVSSGNGPDAILIGATYDGRDIAARLSARLDLPVLTNIVGMQARDGALVTEHAIFGGSMVLRAEFTGKGPGIYVIRAKSFGAEPLGSADSAWFPARAHSGHRGPRDGSQRCGPDRRPARGGSKRSQARRGRGRRLRGTGARHPGELPASSPNWPDS